MAAANCRRQPGFSCRKTWIGKNCFSSPGQTRIWLIYGDGGHSKSNVEGGFPSSPFHNPFLVAAFLSLRLAAKEEN